MSRDALPAGKLPAQLLTRLLGEVPTAPEVLVGPRLGEDACVIDVPAGALVAAADPITLTGAGAGRMAVVVNANDVAVMGVQPRWFLAVLLLPPGTQEPEVADLFASVRAGLDDVGAVLVGGHTELTTAVRQPVVVGQMLGLASDGRFVTTSGTRPGDVVVQVGPAPVEGAAVLAAEAVGRLGDVPYGVLRAALRATDDPGISVVAAALHAARLGATAMHDPTEGGIAAALHELAMAAGVGLRIERDDVRWFPPGVALCQALGADPWGTLASGTLLATFAPGEAEAAVTALVAAGHDAVAIGAVEAGEGVRDEHGDELPWPARDEVARVLAG